MPAHAHARIRGFCVSICMNQHSSSVFGRCIKKVINHKYIYYKVYYSMHHIIIKNEL